MTDSTTPPQNVIPNSYIVMFKQGLTLEQKASVKQQLQKDYGATIVHEYDTAIDGFSFRVPSDKSTSSFTWLSQLAEVDIVEQDQVASIQNN
jgi:hypothetical protein